MNTEQTGQEQIHNYSRALSAQLQVMAVRYGLDIAETEALTRWVSTVMETPTQSICQLREMLTAGSKSLEMTSGRVGLQYGILQAILHAHPGARYAAITVLHGEPTQVRVWLRR